MCGLQGQSEFMREWLAVADKYLEVLVQHEGYTGNRLCQKGCGREGNWRCLDCFGQPLSCMECCRSDHSRAPFHCVEVWCGQYFSPSSLSALGIVLHLGHGGKPCPNAVPHCENEWEDESDDSGRDNFDDRGPADPNDMPAFNHILSFLGHRNEHPYAEKQHDVDGHPLVTIIDKSGIHRLAIQQCRCFGQPPTHHQLMKISLYPATQTSPRTVFTLAVLDDFRLMNLECKVTVNSVFKYLRRISNPVFPHTQPVSGTASLKCLSMIFFSPRTTITN
jgi:hypothetical protein